MAKPKNEMVRKYLDWLSRDRGARIAFLVFAFSWPVAYAIGLILEVLPDIFPAVSATPIFLALDSAARSVMDLVTGLFSWYPSLGRRLGFPTSASYLFSSSPRSRRSAIGAELVVSSVTALAFTLLLGLLGTALYEAFRILMGKRRRD